MRAPCECLICRAVRGEFDSRPWTPMFPRRDGWDVWGNEVPQDVALVTQNDAISDGENVE